MKFFKFGIHLWITMISFISFLLGWIILAHAPKPVQLNSASSQTSLTAQLPTLEPLAPSPEFGIEENSTQNEPFFGFQPRRRSQGNPFFTTGGS
jgi:hypothetical protein